MLSFLLIPFLLASPPVYDSEAAYNKTNSASKETRRRSQKISRTTKNRSIKRRTKRRYRRNAVKHRLKIRRKTSRATTYTNKQVNKRTTNKVRKTQVQRHHIQSTQKNSKSSKGKRSARSPVHLTPLQKQILRLQMEVLLKDPEMGHIYRQILDSKK